MKVCLEERGRQIERRVYAVYVHVGVCACVCVSACGVCACVHVRVHVWAHVQLCMCLSRKQQQEKKTQHCEKTQREDSSNRLQTTTRGKVGLDCCQMGLLSPDRQRQSSVLSPVEGGC